jgi:hypothetical protein
VDHNSAILGLGFPQEVLYRVQESNHSSICKFKSKDRNYEIIISYLADLVDYSLTANDAKSWSESTSSLSRPNSNNTFLATTELGCSPHLSDHSTIVVDRHRSASPFGSPNARRDDGPWFTQPNIGTSKFLGRGAILESIQEILKFENSSQVRVALHGLGGVGKTQIALRLSEWYRQSYPQDSVFWVRAANFDVFKESIENIAIACGLLGAEQNQAVTLNSVQQHLLDKRNGGWLIVVDSVDTYDSVENPSRSSSKSTNSTRNMRRVPITNMIPRCSHGRVLFTTNSKIVASQTVAPEGHVLEIPPMSSQEAQELLQRQLSVASTPSEGPPNYESIPATDDVERLVKHLGNLPLAIAQAAAYMRQRTLTTAAYLELIALDESTLTDLLQSDFQGYETDRDFSKAIAATWNRAFDAIRSESSSAMELLSFISFLEPQNIPKSLLKALQSDERQLTANSLGTLQAYALVSYDPVSSTCNIHRLVQLAMRNRLRDEEILETSATRALYILQKSFPDKASPRWDKRDLLTAAKNATLLSHALQVLKNEFTNSDESNISASTLASNISNYYMQQGNFSEALKLADTAKTYLEKVGEPPRALVLSNQATEVMALREADRLDEAEELANSVYLGYKKEFRSKITDMIDIRLLQSLIHQDRGRYKESLSITRDCVKVLEKQKSEDWQLMIAKARLGRILYYVGDYTESERILRDVLEVLEASTQKLGPNSIETLKIRHRMSFAVLALGRAAECEKLCTETWEAQKEALGEYHPDVLKTLSLKATAMQELGKYDAALRYHRRIYRKASDILGPDHRYTCMAASMLADNLSLLRDPKNGSQFTASLEEAAKLYRYVLRSTPEEKKAQPDHLQTQSSLANVVRLQGKPTEAEKLQREAYSKLKETLGKAHPFTLNAREGLARCLKDLGKDKEANKCAIKLLDRREKALEWSHPSTLRAAQLVVEMTPDDKKSRKVQARLVNSNLRTTSSSSNKPEQGTTSSEDSEEEGRGSEKRKLVLGS